MSIIISEDLWWPISDSFLSKHDVHYDATLVAKPDMLRAKMADATALIVRNKTNVNSDLLNHAKHLKIVGRLGVGLDNIDVLACRERGIQVVSARGCNATSVAEYVLACLFHHSRFLSRCSDNVKSGDWNRAFGTGQEIYQKTLGLIGVGDIGQRVAYRAKAFGMNVLAYDPFVFASSSLVQDLGVKLVGLDELLEQSHFASIHVPLTPQTRHLIGEAQLRLMRDDSVIINTARGGIVDESALYQVLVDSPERAAFLDVLEHEPPAADDLLLSLPNAMFTPHVAGVTKESSTRVAEFILQQVDHALDGKPVQGLV